MAKLSIKAGATSQSINIFVQNSSSTTGAGLTGFATAGGSLLTGMIFYYSFGGTGAGSVVQSLSVPATVGAAFSAGNIVEIDATHMAGVARLDLPNAMIASGNGRFVTAVISGGTNVAPVVLEIELTGWDNQDAVHGGMSALPNASPGASNGLLIAGTNVATTIQGLTLSGVAAVTSTPATAGLTVTGGAASTTGGGTAAAAIVATGGSGAASTNGAASGATITAGGTNTVSSTADGLTITGKSNGNGMTLTHAGTGKDLNATTTPLTLAKTTNITGFNDITAAAAATGVWQDTTSGDFTVASSIGKSLYTSGNAPGAASGLALVGSNMGTVSSVTGAVGSVTGNVGGNVVGSVASVTAAVAITSNRKKGSTATFEFLMQDSTTGAPKTGLTVSMVISKDGGSAVTTSNSVTEIGLGQYQIVLTGTEMTANNIFLQGTATGALTFNLAAQTQP